MSTTLSNQYSLIRSLSGAEGKLYAQKIPTLTSRDFCLCTNIVILLVAVWTPRLQLLEEVVALVIDQDERREILYCNLPDCLHAEFGILNALDALDAAL